MSKRELFTTVIIILSLIPLVSALAAFIPQLLHWEMNENQETVPYTVYLISKVIIPFLIIRMAKPIVNFLFQKVDLDAQIDLGELGYENTLKLAVIITGLILVIKNTTAMFLSFSSILGSNVLYYIASIAIGIYLVIRARQISSWIIRINRPPN